MPTLKLFDAVCKTAVISFVLINLTQDVQLELLYYHIEFHPDQMKDEQKIVTPTQSNIKW